METPSSVPTKISRRRKRKDAQLFSVAQYRLRAKRALPPMVFDFVDGGAGDEATVRGNEAAYADWWLRPRPLNDVAERTQTVSLLGSPMPTPLVLGPAGLAGLVWPHGEAVAAAAASRIGIPFAVSTASSCSIEDVRRAADGPLWLQLYLWRDREVTGSLVDRAMNAGYDTLCLTVDVPLSGSRERDLRNGMTIPPRIGFKNALGVLSRPRWVKKVGRAPVTFANVSEGQKGRTMALGAYVNSQLNPSASWQDLEWLRSKWKGKLLVKGVLDGESAVRLADEGVDGVIVSNHGGRQLDGAIPTLRALPGITAAVAGRIPLLIDGGIRRGTDVIKALALGADACLIARPYLWGLAAEGERGVSRVVEILRHEIDQDLALLGVSKIDDVKGQAERFLLAANSSPPDSQR
jgi:isopentenyl diphosphate isomerase/L-lactate dehydrogenase-like FMN-dependent dehydrogenase